nr:hypothetical protein [Calditrichia bacterium]
EENVFLGGLGMTWVDGQPYTTFTLAPDFAFGKIGVGVYLQLLLDNNNNWKLREDEYKGGAGILRAIRYLRYGQKYDAYYARIGMLDRAILGNGFLLWNYNNGSNYDKRNVGLVADLDFGGVGIESVIGSLGDGDLMGYNVFVRPFELAGSESGILKRIRLYSTLVRDNKVATANPDSSADLTAFGVGADFRWLDLPILKSAIYSDFAKFSGGTGTDYGSGTAVGISATFPDFIGLFALGARFEKRFIQDQFIPSLFGPVYELERRVYIPDGENGPIGALARLEAAEKSQGYFGELSGHLINKVRLIGNYQRLNGIKRSGIIHLEASAPDLVPKFELAAYYDKSRVETFRDFRTLDPLSVLTAEVGYQLNSFLLLTTIYRWNWVESPDQPGVYTRIERIEPRISFRYRF